LRYALETAVGCALGLLVWGAAAAAGVTALVTASHTAAMVLRLAGAGYLIVLGVALLRHRDSSAAVRLPGLRTHLPPFGQGLLNNLLNPKAAVFFTALLPQFLPKGGSTLASTLGLAMIAAAASFVGLASYAVVTHKTRRLVAAQTSAVLDRLAGLTLIGLGIALGLRPTREST
jgi:threonine/homoserine/homoserine lactone efflux protein